MLSQAYNSLGQGKGWGDAAWVVSCWDCDVVGLGFFGFPPFYSVL